MHLIFAFEKKIQYARFAVSLILLWHWLDLYFFPPHSWEEQVAPIVSFLPRLLENPLVYFLWSAVGIVGFFLLLFKKSFRLGALSSWIWLAILSASNRIISQIHYDYLGWILWFLVLFGSEKKWRDQVMKIALYLPFALGYTVAGLGKILSSVWTSGNSITYMGQLARAQNFFPSAPSIAIFIALLQFLAFPLILHKKTAPWAWLSLTVLQLGILVFFKNQELTIPVLFFHYFVFSEDWTNLEAWFPQPVVSWLKGRPYLSQKKIDS